ncbi:MAG: ATP-dependent DNA helicase RecG [Candidatus Promineifilaceae bacterium]
MGRAFENLERVINLESEQGYKNRAVVGGIGQFAALWVSQAQEETSDEADLALIEQISEVLSGYGRLPGTEARAAAIASLQDKLRVRERRHAGTPTGQAAAARSAKPAPAPRVEEAPPVQESDEGEDEVDDDDEVIVDPELLRQPVIVIRGVGRVVAERLAVLDLHTIEDLLYHFPHRYDDYTLLQPINRLSFGDQVTIIGTIWETRLRRTRNLKLVESVITDGTGKIQATWFNQPWLAEKLKAGQQIVLSGTVDQYLGRPVFQNPAWEPLEMDPLRTRRIVPVYPLTQGISAQKMREIMKRAVAEFARHVPDPLPAPLRKNLGFYKLPKALKQIHFPDKQENIHRARQRIAFDELFLLQLGMLGMRRDWQAAPGLPIPLDARALEHFFEGLPFLLTRAQQRVIAEIAADMREGVPMNRLLQGDVGSGKTVVAAAAMVLVVQAGYQAAMMAPTEILAEQHYQGIKKMLDGMDINVTLLTGSTTAAERTRIYQEISDGAAQVVLGTHALIQENVQFQHLALAIIDEQHRFGVDQRAALRDKGTVSTNGNGAGGPNPHLLVMSATPIPRSLALSIYGDLDLSIVDELPPGRQEIKTRWLRPSERERAYSFVRGQCEQGRQAFVICPLVEESDKIVAKSAVEEYARLQEQVFPDLKLGLLHGRMKADEKEEAMRAFSAGETDILVATSVIEVGIDIPNSTVMLIEGANRFGLAQLHQFRGRVGRGEHQSYCLLLADAISEDAEQRLAALEQTNDGFLLAEKDLEIRGPGEFLGRQQSGLPELHLASLTDMALLEVAREQAQAVFREDPLLEAPEHELMSRQVKAMWREAGDIS